MKRLAMLAVSIYVAGSSSPTVIDLGGDHWMDIIVEKRTCMEDFACPSSTAIPTAVPVSTGPFILKASTGTNCYSVPYINPNGTIPKSPADWVKCP